MSICIYENFNVYHCTECFQLNLLLAKLNISCCNHRFNEESSIIVSGSRDNSVMCWDGRSKAQEAVQSLNDAKDSISSVRVSDHEILSGSFDGKIRTYDIRVGELCEDYMGGKK